MAPSFPLKELKICLLMNLPTLKPSKKENCWIEEDILFCKFNQLDCYLSESVAKVYLSKIEDLVNNKPMPFIVDLRNFVGNFSPKAAKLIAESPIIENSITTQAFVANSLHSKLLVGSYVRIYVNTVHVKIFNTVEKALAYCLESKNKFDATTD